jgi:hypothetical protein
MRGWSYLFSVAERPEITAVERGLIRSSPTSMSVDMKRYYFIAPAVIAGVLTLFWSLFRGEPRDRVVLIPMGSLIHPEWGPTFAFEMTNGYQHMIDFELLGAEIKTDAGWQLIPNTGNARVDRVGPTQSGSVWLPIPKGKVPWRIVVRYRKFPEGNEARIRAAAAKIGTVSYYPPWETVTSPGITN